MNSVLPQICSRFSNLPIFLVLLLPQVKKRLKIAKACAQPDAIYYAESKWKVWK